MDKGSNGPTGQRDSYQTRSKNKDPKNSYWSLVDEDIWTKLRKVTNQDWQIEWVRGHPEHKKKKSKDPKLSKFFVSTDYKYTLDERLNIVVDKIAGEAYQKCNVRSDKVIADAQWNAIRDTYGTVTWNHYVISGKTGTTIKRCSQKE